MDTSSIGVFLGTGICALVGSQVSLAVLRSLQQLRGDRRQYQLRRRLLETEVQRLSQRCEREQSDVGVWEGLRKFRVERKVPETRDVCSFYLTAHDGKPLPHFIPGQYLTFSLKLDNEKPLMRCYSLSDRPGLNYYRVTIRKILPPLNRTDLTPGRGSSHFVDVVQEGDILDVKAPRGKFTWDESNPRPLVMLAAGIGITPLLSMLNAIVDRGIRQQVYLFNSVRNSAEHPFKQHIEELSRLDFVHVHTFYTLPRAEDQLHADFQHTGRMSIGHLREILPSNNFEFLVCGPSEFMQTTTKDLAAWGVPKADIKSEAFGPSSVKVKAKPKPTAATATKSEVCFDRTGKTVVWDGTQTSLLDLADAASVPMESGCRAGSCGACLVAVKSGKVVYPAESGVKVDEGTCLPCVGVPDGAVVLDA